MIRKNVREHLSPEHQEAIDARIRAAYNMADYDKAKESLELTVRYLERLKSSAAASLKEGLEETLSVHRLGVTGLSRKILAVAELLSAEKKLKRVKGNREFPIIVADLGRRNH